MTGEQQPALTLAQLLQALDGLHPGRGVWAEQSPPLPGTRQYDVVGVHVESGCVVLELREP